MLLLQDLNAEFLKLRSIQLWRSPTNPPVLECSEPFRLEALNSLGDGPVIQARPRRGIVCALALCYEGERQDAFSDAPVPFTGCELPHRRTWPVYDDDAGHERVHPTLPHPRAPQGFHRIRHYGLLASTAKAEMVAKVRDLLSLPATEPDAQDVATEHVQQCPCCGGRMHIIETFAPSIQPSHCSSAHVGAIRIDTS